MQRTLLERQRAAFAREPYPPAPVRVERLMRLEQMLRQHGDALAEAIRRDFGHRSLHETRLLELFPTLQAIGFLRRHVRRWMKPRLRGVGLWFRPGRARIVAQPVGVAGIIAPWNYPLSLTLEPLAAALAAGNHAMVKMSEFAPATAALLAELLSQAFAPELVAVVQGDAAVAESFSRLPFDHLLFTGSTPVGRAVMQAAAEHLTPVTLELGGKSPALVAPDYPLAHAVARIVAGKCLNAGQTCIAPDYVLLPEVQVPAFVEQARREVANSYPDGPQTPDYSAVVSDRHYERLQALVADACAKGAEAVPLAGTGADPATRKFPPTVLLGVRDDMRVMQEEIFGPLLPVVPYRTVEEALAYVQARPRPLALYAFDRNRGRLRQVLEQTHSGGVTVNDTLLHYAQCDLPFGGIGSSGMGRYHGREGFDTFSNLKGVFIQSRWNGVGLLKPPYGRRFGRMLKLMLR